MGCVSVNFLNTKMCCVSDKYPIINENIIKYIAFAPPEKCNYKLNEIDNLPFSSNYKICKFIHKDYQEQIYPWIEVISFKLKKTNSNQLAVLHIKNKKFFLIF